MAKGESARLLLERAAQLQAAGKVGDAIAAYEQLLAMQPNLPESWYNLGFLRRRAGRFEGALSAYAEALARDVSGPEEAHLNRGVILADHLARPDEAKAELDAALALNPDYVPAWLNLGNLNEDRGDRAGACAAYERALSLDPGNMLALARLGGVSEVNGADDAVIGRLREGIARTTSTDADRADLGFALGRLLDSAAAYDQAFDAYAQANAASRVAAGGIAYDAAAHELYIDRLIAAFPRAAPANDSDSGEAPIFICGLFRSGSTLAEQILGCHSRVQPGGELGLLPTLIHSRLGSYPEGVTRKTIGEVRAAYLEQLRELHPGTARVTDKRPDNFLHIGLIKSAFPEAKIVHTVRHPIDNLLSMWFLHLDPNMAYALELRDLVHWYEQYRRLMAHWEALYGSDIFDLDYDDLVTDPEAKIAALLAYCGLDWEPSCLDFHRTTNPVRTASVWQVREPLHSRSSGRWRNYRRHLSGLLDQSS